METKENRWGRLRKRWRAKYKLVILNDQTYEEKVSFRLSRLNVFVLMGTVFIVLVSVVIVLIAFTPLREYIPGYTDVTLYDKIDNLQRKSDSLEQDFNTKNLYIYNLQRILEGNDTVAEMPEIVNSDINYDAITALPSREDSILRADFESQSMYNIYLIGEENKYSGSSSIRGFNFFTPLVGIVSSHFDPAIGHFGIDIVSNKEDAIKSTLDGVIVFSNWTLETGYVLGIQHEHNLFSVYKHNSTLLKGQGDFVKAGQPIAIVGETGEYTTGPHLHFELWYNGTPVNPADFMIF